MKFQRILDHNSNFVADIEDMDAMIGVVDNTQTPLRPHTILSTPLPAILAFQFEYAIPYPIIRVEFAIRTVTPLADARDTKTLRRRTLAILR